MRCPNPITLRLYLLQNEPRLRVCTKTALEQHFPRTLGKKRTRLRAHDASSQEGTSARSVDDREVAICFCHSQRIALLCGRQDLKNAAMAGAVDTLLISGDAWLTSVEDETVVLTKRHGGRVVRACSPHYELDLLGVCALLRFPMREESDEHEIKAVEEQEAARDRKSVV